MHVMLLSMHSSSWYKQVSGAVAPFVMYVMFLSKHSSSWYKQVLGVVTPFVMLKLS